jgi:membrane-bound lytic murein transglycosylase A
MRFILISLFLIFVAACTTPAPKPETDRLSLKPVSFSDLSGWQKDTPQAALVAFRKSCAVLTKKPPTTSLGIAGVASAWHDICGEAQNIPDNEESVRTYFEKNFQPYMVVGSTGENGLFTGYYVPELHGSYQRGGAFQTPLYARPSDIISVDLGVFKTNLKGQHILGKVVGQNLVPYDDRAAITKNSLADRAQVLVWVDDPIDAFFLEVQGSGLVTLEDGNTMTVGYDGINGHGYVAIGRVLADRGDLPRPVTMPAIRQWLETHPEQAQQVMNENPSYVFFKTLPDVNVTGAEGVSLTTERSLAVDPSFIPLGLPIWLDTTDGQGTKLQRLMIAQDTGGAIKGAVRGDVFWGPGPEASIQAGAMQSQGRYYVFLPKAVSPHDN